MAERKTFKSRRAFLNYKLHAYSIAICGDKSVLEQAVYEKLKERGLSHQDITSCSVLQLTDEEAEAVHTDLNDTNKRVQANVNKAHEYTGQNQDMTYKQRNLIIKLTKYNWKWTPEATFSYLLETLPHIRQRLNSFEIQKSKLKPLYSQMTSEDADKVIKRLTQLEKNNKQINERNI
ncbi:MAG TPA: hypothetical protein PK605_00290 [Ignavibacteria bacterium]|nr:hypothetical protein [Bacteroidota bacterium]HRE10781.1 hypothetical protein [Ignavibacteria bacterium]HRF65976.1 hypothetical protein [Ignavibacteria bacterium]HRJ02817.1 hypothetical protein [Ignavibacteria bacterium]HRJ84375.1 hypothetical protein [Ignavibacteria bacterium]